ncbi:6-phosphogluconate dehydrogenase [Arachidicoccus ginsenosidimutans]|uniref:NAD(P)-dependent oxidoreductase n=1 Tax=Arachidicoccus sp. BS20 TaxID=1850526 RepID=UPI0007F1084F|nr:NAD(P)-dependent oxidoreductase [Arachidicoccus sp. BS20]ANI89670.1 6-phosphogluconate dehydrogenase [Arachidicoccus sp. BS20]
MVAYLGTGLLGANFTRAMLKRGVEVQVWNRTSEKAFALEQYGAKAFEDVTKAVENASVIHLTLKDDASVDEVLEKASAAFKKGVIIIDHTTTSASGAVKRTAYWKEKGFVYQHAPVFMGPQNALDATGYMLVSGDRKLIANLQPDLSAMTGKLLNFGETVGKAASMKLIGNLFLITFTAGLSDVLSLAEAQDISTEDILSLLNEWNPAASSIPDRLKKMSGTDFSNPSWELNMARKDTQLFMNAVNEAGQSFTVIPAIAKRMDTLIAEGHGNEDWMVIGKKQ